MPLHTKGRPQFTRPPTQGRVAPAHIDRASCTQPRRPPLGRSFASRISIRVLPSLQPECRRARDTFWDIPVPKMTALGDSLVSPGSPCVRGATPTSSQARCRLRTTPTNGLTVCRMRLHMPSIGSGTFGPCANSGHTHAPTPTGDYAPSLRSPWRAAHVVPSAAAAHYRSFLGSPQSPVPHHFQRQS